MENKHIPVMLEEIKSYIPINKELNIIDATFGGGGYSKAILEEFNVKNLVAIDRDPISKVFFGLNLFLISKLFWQKIYS